MTLAENLMTAIQVRDLIGEMMDVHCDVGESRDTGVGLGSADIWLRIGGFEYVVSVHSGRPYKPTPKHSELRDGDPGMGVV